MSTSHLIPACNIDRLETTLARMQRRTVKLGVEPIVFTKGEPIYQTNEDGFVHTFYSVEVSGVAPMINGWEIAAILDHDGEETIIQNVSGADVDPRFRKAKPWCEHCRLHRRRNDTFVLRSIAEPGLFVQVGSNCLKDFTGHEDPSAIAARAEYLAEARALVEECSFMGEGGWGAPSGLMISVYLAYVCAVIRHHGWVSRKTAKESEWKMDIGQSLVASADRAIEWMAANARGRRRAAGALFPEPTPADFEKAEAALVWGRALGGANEDVVLSEYEYNVRAACRRPEVQDRTKGLIASLVPAYDRELERRAPRPPSEYVGTFNARCTFVVTVYRTFPVVSQFGTAYRYLMRTHEGAIVVWKSSSGDLETGNTYRLTGRVEGHVPYVGKDRAGEPLTPVKQTILSRCKVDQLFTGAEVLAGEHLVPVAPPAKKSRANKAIEAAQAA